MDHHGCFFNKLLTFFGLKTFLCFLPPYIAMAQTKTNMIENFLLGGTAAIGKTATTPIERAKALITFTNLERAVPPYKGFFDVFVRVPREEGLTYLWRGNLFNLIRYFPSQALIFMFKDFYRQ